jgi:HlyD family secretion protein
MAEVLTGMQTSIVAARESARDARGGGPPSGPNDAMKNIRSQTEIALRGFLTPEQIQQYQGLNQQRPMPRGSQEENTDFQRGVVWVLRDGEPQSINVRVGIADLEYSEIKSDDLQEGDAVITRAQRVTN